jgi:hypothetical protein
MNVEPPETLVIIESIVYKSNGFAIGCFLGASPEAKAASFTFAPTITFEVIDGGYDGDSFDGLGNLVFPGNFDTVVRGTLGEAAQLAEFNIGSFSLAPNTVISSAVFQLSFTLW